MVSDQDKKVLDELNETLAQAQTAEAEKLPKEHLSDFETDGMTYLDISAAILDQTENLFQVTGECNRFAPEYLSYCKTLITAVNHLGSAFMTKTAMYCRNFSTEQVETLTVERLNRMLSFNFRKCNAALTEIREKRQEFDLNYFNMLLSFDTAMQRLRATQKRAYDMNLGMTSPHRIAETALSFTQKDGCRKLVKEYSKDAPFRESPAYAVRYDALEEAENQLQTAVEEELPETEPEFHADISAVQENQPEPVSEISEEPAYVTADSTVDADEVPNQIPADLDEASSEEKIKFAVDFDQIDTRFVDRKLEWKVLDMIDQYPEQAWQEIYEHLQDPVYCQIYTEYVKVFVKLIKAKMEAAAKDEKT